MSSAGHFNTPAQILPKHLKWQEHVVVPEDFSKDEILELKKWSRITGDEDSGYEPVYLSTWNGQPTLRDDGNVKVKVDKVEVKLEDVGVMNEVVEVVVLTVAFACAASSSNIFLHFCKAPSVRYCAGVLSS